MNLFENEIENFAMFSEPEGNLGIPLEQFPSGISMVEFEIKDNSKSYTLVFYAGFVGTIQNKKNELKAEINWAIGKKSEMGQLRNSMSELQK